MKRIKFDNIAGNWKLKMLIIISVFFLLLGLFEPLHFENPLINEIFMKIGFLFQILFFGRMVFFKNYVQWNKIGIMVRINSFFGTNLRFDDIKSSILEDNILKISRKDGKNYNFDLNNVDKNDSKKLNDIINQHCCK